MSEEETEQSDTTFPHFKKALIDKSACRVCGNCGQIYQTETVGFQSTKITQESKVEKKEMEMKETLIYSKPLMTGGQWEKLVESLWNNFQISKWSSEIGIVSLWK